MLSTPRMFRGNCIAANNFYGKCAFSAPFWGGGQRGGSHFTVAKLAKALSLCLGRNHDKLWLTLRDILGLGAFWFQPDFWMMADTQKGRIKIPNRVLDLPIESSPPWKRSGRQFMTDLSCHIFSAAGFHINHSFWQFLVTRQLHKYDFLFLSIFQTYHESTHLEITFFFPFLLRDIGAASHGHRRRRPHVRKQRPHRL